MHDIFDIEIRRNIYDLISKKPGLNLNEIVKHLQIGHQLAGYHINYLIKNELIVAEAMEEAHRRYYIKGKVGVIDKKLLPILRQDIPLEIILLLLQQSYLQHKDILAYFQLAPSTLSYYLKKLVKKGVIAVDVVGGIRQYYVVNQKEIIQCIVRYKPSPVYKRVTDTWVDDFII